MTFKHFLLENETIDKQLKQLGLSRSKYGVGKVMMDSLYIHKDFIKLLPEDIQMNINNAIEMLPQDFEYTAIKYNKDGTVSFIYSPDFDISDEPIVGTSIKVTGDKLGVTKPSSDPLIWHHKWQWVTDEYKGFDVQQSKERSLKWKTILGKNKDISNRIGRLTFWKQWTSENQL